VVLALGFLPAAGQRLGHAGGDHRGFPHSVVEKIVDAV